MSSPVFYEAMRILPASSYKTRGTKGPPLADSGVPEPGSVRRIVFDFFRERKGQPVKNTEVWPLCKAGGSRVIDDLKDFWGLDIRSVPDCHHKCLVGEWFGDKYVDYVAEKIK